MEVSNTANKRNSSELESDTITKIESNTMGCLAALKEAPTKSIFFTHGYNDKR